jgi:hypothetical protein
LAGIHHNILQENCSIKSIFRVRTGPGKPGKSWNFNIPKSRPGNPGKSILVMESHGNKYFTYFNLPIITLI